MSFISNFPSGRSDISVISHDAEKGYILVQATLWRDSKDEQPAGRRRHDPRRVQGSREHEAQDGEGRGHGRPGLLRQAGRRPGLGDRIGRLFQRRPAFVLIPTFAISR